MDKQNIMHPALATWQASGLKYIYFSDPEELNLHKNVGVIASKQNVKTTPAPSPTPSNTRSQIKATSDQEIQKSKLKDQIKKVTSLATNLKLENKTLDFALWSDKWLELYNKSSQNPLVLWTYQEFGEDLLGSPNPARKKIIAYFLSNLRHSKGTHSFWATDIPNNPVNNQEFSLFWSGVEQLKPRALVVFGENTRDFINLPAQLKAYSNQRVNNMFTLLLPDINKLVENPDMVNSVLAFLQSSLDFANSNNNS